MEQLKLKTKLRLWGTLALFIFLSLNVSAQVTVGFDTAPAKAALLELKTQEPDGNNATSDKGGLLLSRVELKAINSLMPFIPDTELAAEGAKHIGLTVYNITPVPDENIVEGTYTWNGAKWINALSETFFYLPSFDLDISSIGNKQIDLYTDVFKKQFTEVGNAEYVSSNSSLETVTSILDANKYDYIVTGYTSDVIKVNSISATGIMSYEVKTINGAGAYINIVLRVR